MKRKQPSFPTVSLILCCLNININVNVNFYGTRTGIIDTRSGIHQASAYLTSYHTTGITRRTYLQQRLQSASALPDDHDHNNDDNNNDNDNDDRPSDFGSYSARFLDGNGLTIVTNDEGRVTARPTDATDPPLVSSNDAVVKHEPFRANRKILMESPAQIVPETGFNVVLTHCTADFDSLASAVGLAKLWSHGKTITGKEYIGKEVPTFVVLPRGAHPAVQRFLALHKHLFPIRSLRSLPTDLSGLDRLGLVDAQRRDRIGPAEHLLGIAKAVIVVDHHFDAETDIPEATEYVVDKVGSVSTMVVEKLRDNNMELTEAEATLLALGIHADTGSLCYDSTTPRDALALAWVMEQGASQAAIAEHAQTSLSTEQQGVLTQALINTNSTVVHGVTVSTVLLSADGFINGLATVTQDAMELSSSDVFLLALVYEARSGGSRRSKKSTKEQLQSRLLQSRASLAPAATYTMEAEAWTGGEEFLKRKRLRAAFDRRDTDGSGFLEQSEIAIALSQGGVVVNEEAVEQIMQAIDLDGNGRIDFEEFVAFFHDAESRVKEQESTMGKKPSTMIIIGRAKAGVSLKSVRLNHLLERFGGGGHPKAASATVRLTDESEAVEILQSLVDEVIDDSLSRQPCVGDFMTAPVLSAKPYMTDKQVEDLFTCYDVRALPVVDDDNEVIGLVTYKEVAAAKQRLWNKEQKRIRQEANSGEVKRGDDKAERKLGSALKGWMKQHVTTIDASTTMAEVEAILLENDVGCMPVVADGTNQLVGMVTRTDLLRQHRYYPSLHYHNKGFSNSIAARKPIIELRKRLKQFDLDD
jgi:nanoRNase/pAp phosphatase (c-di-AMP/oligoRNAs hydrolase)